MYIDNVTKEDLKALKDRGARSYVLNFNETVLRIVSDGNHKGTAITSYFHMILQKSTTDPTGIFHIYGWDIWTGLNFLKEGDRIIFRFNENGTSSLRNDGYIWHTVYFEIYRKDKCILKMKVLDQIAKENSGGNCINTPYRWNETRLNKWIIY